MLNVDINSNMFFIWDVKLAKRAYDIPSDLITLCSYGKDAVTKSSIKDMASKVRLLNNERL